MWRHGLRGYANRQRRNTKTDGLCPGARAFMARTGRTQPADVVQKARTVAVVAHCAGKHPRGVPQKGFRSRYSPPPRLRISPDTKSLGGGL